VFILFIFFYHKIFAITFDESFAKAGGIKTGMYNMLIALLTALTIVLGMRMMGAMLISSLIIFPALTSMRIFKTFRSVTICSAILAMTCFFIGIVISYLYATPAGASVVMMNIFAFLLFWAISAVSRRNIRREEVVKKAALVSITAILLFAGCNNNNNNAAAASPVVNSAEESISLAPADLEIREKMFIAQVNDIYLNSDDYLGKTVRLEGLFKYAQADDRAYCFVIRNGPGCCGDDGQVGFEVSWAVPGQPSVGIVKSYPKVDDWVVAQGVLKEYDEFGFPFLYLALSDLKVLDKRGEEFVVQ
jgi:uncharacterized membrane protein YcgQ (UPF0703/DUF1980 family)